MQCMYIISTPNTIQCRAYSLPVTLYSMFSHSCAYWTANVETTCMNFEVALCGSAFNVALPFVIPNNNDNIHQMAERRACDGISVTKRN